MGAVHLNIFMENIKLETLHDHHTYISLGGRHIFNLLFADEKDLMTHSSKFTNRPMVWTHMEWGLPLTRAKSYATATATAKAEIWRHHLTHAQWSPCTRLNYSGDERHLAAAAEWLSTHNLHCCLFLEHSEHHSARIAFVSYFSLHDHHRQKRGQALFLCLGKEGSDVHGN